MTNGREDDQRQLQDEYFWEDYYLSELGKQCQEQQRIDMEEIRINTITQWEREYVEFYKNQYFYQKVNGTVACDEFCQNILKFFLDRFEKVV